MRECQGGIVLEWTGSSLRVGDPSTRDVLIFDIDPDNGGLLDDDFGDEGPLVGDRVDVVEEDGATLVALRSRPGWVQTDIPLNGFTDGSHGVRVFAEEDTDTGVVTLETIPIWFGKPTAVGGAVTQFRLGDDRHAQQVLASLFGIGDTLRAAQQAMQFHFVHLSDESPYGFFLVDDLGARLAALEQERTRRETRNRLKTEHTTAMERATSRRYVVNPYTFVPFADMTSDDIAANRKAPSGHSQLGVDRFLGSITVSWNVDSPIMIRHTERNDCWEFLRLDGEPAVVGSALKGALRSMHETLTGSCLRVIDPDFVPVYREHLAVQGAAWRIIRVDEVENGYPRKVTVCDEVRWVNQDKIHPIIPASELQTGNTVNLEGGSTLRHQRREHQGKVHLGDEWILLLSHSQARRGGHPYNVAAGRLPEESSSHFKVAPDAYAQYQELVAGTDDLRRHPPDQDDRPTHEDVHFPYSKDDHHPLVGKRQIASQSLRPGDVLWGKISGSRIVALSRASIWRTLGGGPLGERMPTHLRPCVNPTMLCPSCRVFGSIAESGNEDDNDRGAEQLSYRGHILPDSVRFSDSQTEFRTMTLATPHPGSGHTYLDMILPVAAQDTVPSFNWRAGDASNNDLRQLRGRKWYWADSSSARTINTGNPAMEFTAECIIAGKATTTLRFENLTKAEIGGLICALNPSLLLESETPRGYADGGSIAFVLGGGKPLGYGRLIQDPENSMEAELFTARGRYANTGREQASVDELVQAFSESVPESVRDTWPDLAAVLRTGHVNAERIEYPSLNFFKKISGASRTSDEDILNDLGPETPDGSAHVHRPPRSPQQYWEKVEG